jgi:cysteinyl-tRNA synthetase
MPIKFHNTLTNKTEEFKPIDPSEIKLYTCGPTVYSTPHVGNWVAYIYWDVLVRLLMANGYRVKRVMNITDVGHLTSDADEGEDKLQKGANREGKTAWDVAKFYTDVFMDGMHRLKLSPPNHITKATEFIPQQLELLKTLKDKGCTYQTEDGIYFDTSKFATYKDFARLDLDAIKAGARVEYIASKRNPSDFALWKFSRPNEHRDMEWETPVDILENSDSQSAATSPIMGFPGWHLECSAMALSILGNTIDIHTGGVDHIPVHHTNEIAQSEAATGVQFCHYWLHNNHLKVNGTKISKSLENGYTLDDLERLGYSPMDFKMFVLQGNYHNEGNFTFENLLSARNRLNKWKDIAVLRHQLHDTLEAPAQAQGDDSQRLSIETAPIMLLDALNNDMGTPEAMRIIEASFDKIASSHLAKINRQAIISLLETIDELLGLDLMGATPDLSDDIKNLLVQRQRCREEKDWSKSDTIRDELLEIGIVLKDNDKESIWAYKHLEPTEA